MGTPRFELGICCSEGNRLQSIRPCARLRKRRNRLATYTAHLLIWVVPYWTSQPLTQYSRVLLLYY